MYFYDGKQMDNTTVDVNKLEGYKSLDDAWSHQKIEQTREGEIYAITNTAWINWYKIGKAVNAKDRLNAYQTGSPFRNYELLMSYKVDNRHVAERKIHKLLVKHKYNRKGEWFYIDELDELKESFWNYLDIFSIWMLNTPDESKGGFHP